MNPEIILGSPGCGKTTALLSIVDAELASGIAPDRIAYLSFTRRAAEEAISRAAVKFSVPRSNFPYFRTLHSLCYRLLGIQSGDVMNQAKLNAFGDWAGVKITGRYSEDGTLNGYEVGDRLLHMENLARVRQISIRDQYDMDNDGLPWDLVDRVTRAYAAYKQQNGLIDFTGMLEQFLKSGIRLKLDVLLNDEAQDQSKLQWAVVQKLAKGVRRVAVAGDDDQALYAWSGADVETFVDLPGAVTVLGQSHRVPRAVQSVAADVIGGVQHRRPKKWAARAVEGMVDYSNTFEDIDCSKGQILVLARNVYLLREVVAPALRRSGIIYDLNGHSSVSRNILDAIVTWEKLRAGENVRVDLVRNAYEYLSSGIGVARGFKKLNMFGDEDVVGMKDLKEKGGLMKDGVWHDALDRVPAEETAYILAARQRGEKLLSEPRVRISTVHGAKGGEADHVVLLKEMARRSFREIELDPDSERRVAYVGVTRARERLTIVEASTQQACPWL